MKKGFFKVLLTVALMASTLLLSACRQGRETVQNGITVENEKPYSGEVLEYAEEVIFSLLEVYAKDGLDVQLPETAVAQLHEYATVVREITEEELISEKSYREMLDHASRLGKDALTEILDKGGSGYEKTKELYLALSHTVGADYVGRLAYKLSIYAMNASEETKLADYERYGYSYLIKEAEYYAECADTLKNGIGEESFISIIKCAFAFSGIIGEDVQNTDAFTSEEIRVFLTHLSLPSPTVTPNGWKLVFSLFNPQASGDRYVDKLLSELFKTGDTDKLAEVASSIVTLIGHAMHNLTAEDVDLFRSEDYALLTVSVFSRFGDEEWATFERIASVEWTDEAYQALARSEYGDEYDEYVSSRTTYSIDELKAACGTDDFYERLMGYVAAVAPYVSYELER